MKIREIILILVLITLALSGQKSLDEQELNDCVKKIKQICVHDVIDLIATDTDIVILDVRKDMDFTRSHLINAVWAPKDSLKSKAKTWFKDEDKLYLLYCQGGQKSAIATYYMTIMGFKAKNIVGGMNAMMGTEMKIVPGKAPGCGKAAE